MAQYHYAEIDGNGVVIGTHSRPTRLVEISDPGDALDASRPAERVVRDGAVLAVPVLELAVLGSGEMAAPEAAREAGAPESVNRYRLSVSLPDGADETAWPLPPVLKLCVGRRTYDLKGREVALALLPGESYHAQITGPRPWRSNKLFIQVSGKPAARAADEFDRPPDSFAADE